MFNSAEHSFLGPFTARFEVRYHSDGHKDQPYAFPGVYPRRMPLLDALQDIPGLGRPVARLRRRPLSGPQPLVRATGMSCEALAEELPGMALSDRAAVYEVPEEWGHVVDQIACQDIQTVFGMPDLDMHGQRPRAARRLQFCGEKAAASLFMDFGIYESLLAGCFGDSDPGFIGRFVPQLVICKDMLTLGGFFFDRAKYELDACGLTSMSGHAVDTSTPEYATAQKEAALVGKEPWRFRPWPGDDLQMAAWMVEITNV